MDINNNQQPDFNQQPGYGQQPMYNQQPVYNQQLEKPVTVGDWIVTILLLGIPVVNLILLFVWAFGGNAPKSKSNFAKAELIWILIAIIFTIFLYVVLGASFYAFLKYFES